MSRQSLQSKRAKGRSSRGAATRLRVVDSDGETCRVSQEEFLEVNKESLFPEEVGRIRKLRIGGSMRIDGFTGEFSIITREA